MLQGYRTILVSFILFVATKIGLHVTGADANAYVAMLPDAWLVISIVMRMLTNTPLGKKIEADAVQAGIPQEVLDKIMSGPDSATLAGLIASVEKVSGDVAALNKPASTQS